MSRISPAIAAIGVLCATAVYAATDTGVIVSVNETDHNLTLSDDEVFFTPPTVDLRKLQIGFTVTVTYTKENNANKASAVDILFPKQASASGPAPAGPR